MFNWCYASEWTAIAFASISTVYLYAWCYDDCCTRSSGWSSNDCNWAYLATMLDFDPTMIALMIALYMAQDSFGTATNVTGDGALAIIVDKFTKEDR